MHRISTILERLDSLERGLDAAVAWKRFATRTWATGSDEVAMADLHVASSRALAGLPVDVGAIIELAGRLDDATAPNDMTAVNELALLLWALGDPRGVDSAESLRSRGVASGDTVFELNGLRFGSWCLMPRGEWAAAERALREELLILPRDSASEWADLAYVLASTGRLAESARILSSLNSSERTRGRTNVLIVQARRGMSALAAGTRRRRRCPRSGPGARRRCRARGAAHPSVPTRPRRGPRRGGPHRRGGLRKLTGSLRSPSEAG